MPTRSRCATPARTSRSDCGQLGGWKRAESHGITPVTPQEAVADADVVGLFVPDHVQRQVWDEVVAPALKPGMTVLFAHGFCIHFGQIVPPEDVNVIMVAPKGPGHLVRRLYSEGAGVPALIAIYQDPSGNARATALAWAIGIGAARAGRARDDLPGGDGVRSLRRAGRALRRHLGAGAGGLRDPRRGRLRPGDRVLRVPPRAEADRRPHVRGRARLDALLDLRHGRVRRSHARPAHRRRPRARDR